MQSRRTYTNILFLDLYGVLITQKSQLGISGFSAFDRDTVFLLKQVSEKYDVELVISSTIRHTIRWKERITKMFKQAGWDDPPVIDRTPLVHRSRGDEIDMWLKENSVEKYAILDDHDDVFKDQRDKLVLCDSREGLTQKKARELEKKFT